ncbi:MAG: hypothetical protein KAT32_04940 [Candidatus Moranbacteria bacterium]|nr:hypothetical protein [Candidatus Moranbacteria bacterium]
MDKITRAREKEIIEIIGKAMNNIVLGYQPNNIIQILNKYKKEGKLIKNFSKKHNGRFFELLNGNIKKVKL